MKSPLITTGMICLLGICNEVTPPNQSNISESAIILPCKTVK